MEARVKRFERHSGDQREPLLGPSQQRVHLGEPGLIKQARGIVLADAALVQEPRLGVAPRFPDAVDVGFEGLPIAGVRDDGVEQQEVSEEDGVEGRRGFP